MNKTAITSTQWVENQNPKNGYDEDRYYNNLPHIMLLKYMEEIKESKLKSTYMLPKEGWEKLASLLEGVNKYSNSLTLADAFIDFLEVWTEYNYGIRVEEACEVRGKKTIFYDELTDKYVYYCGDLHEDLLDKFTDYILKD